MTAKPAAGPLMVRCEPPVKLRNKPPTIPAISPAIGGKPLAMAMPKQSGSAINEIMKPALKSDFQ